MKKILEVLQNENGEIRFDTDIDVNLHPDAIPNISSMAAFSMATNLWGGNEMSVLAVLRALTLADLSLCVNRKEMLEQLEHGSEYLAECLNTVRKEFEKAGEEIHVIYPGSGTGNKCS